MATLYVLQGPDKGRTFDIIHDETTLGRHSEEASLSDHTVSRRHTMLRHNQGRWEIEDLGSSNGTYVNGERISGVTSIKHGDQIKIGSSLMVFGGKTSSKSFGDGQGVRELIDVAGEGGPIDSSILSAVQSSEDSVILATPETADAVRAWNLMYQLAEAISAVTSVRDFFERVTDIVLDHMVADRIFILIRDDDTGELHPTVLRYHSGLKTKNEKVTTSRTIVNHVIETKNGVLCANANTDQRFASNAKAASLEDLALRSVICVPIMAHEEVRGIIHMDCAMSRHTYSHDQLRQVTAVGRMSGMALDNIQLLEMRMRDERLAAVGETVAYLSHHIRNILQGLRSGADVVEMSLKKNNVENVTKGWEIVQHNLDRILRLTSNMLTFSKNREPHIELTQLNAIVEDAAQLFQRQADEKGIMVLTDMEDIPPVPADSEGIHQAIVNLISNAIAACPADSGRVNVGTRYDSANNEVHIIVRDNGSGMSEDQLAHLFKPFTSSKGMSGTGIGLAAAKKIIDELNGKIDVTSTVGKGTRFAIRLPAGDGDAADAEKTHGPPIA